MFQPRHRDEEIRHTQEKASLGRQVLTLLSFLKPLFRVNGRKMYKISSTNNASVVPFQVDCEYCLDGKRNNRNSKVLLCIRFVVLSRKNWLETMFERVIAFKSKAQRLRTCWASPHLLAYSNYRPMGGSGHRWVPSVISPFSQVS